MRQKVFAFSTDFHKEHGLIQQRAGDEQEVKVGE